jgi:two-component system OmpR family sensor kinase
MSHRPRPITGAALRRLPLRFRLVAGFSAAITVVLLGAGAFVYWRVSYALDLRLNTDLSDDADALTPLVTTAGSLRPDPGTAGTPASRLYQILDPTGRVLSSGADLGPAPVISAALVSTAQHTIVRHDVGTLLPRSNHPLRFLIVAVPADVRGRSAGQPSVLVVGIRRDQRDEALRELMAQLGIAGIATLLISAVVGERLSKAALAPVERYRTQASAIADGASGVRLDVPPGRNDEVTRLGATLNTMHQALEQTVEREKRFAAEASHELRTPLTLISTRLQLALSRERTTMEYQETLTELRRDVEELTSLASDLLEMASAVEKPTTTPTTVYTARELVRSMVISGTDLDAHTSLIDEIPSGEPLLTTTVPLSARRLGQVLSNLLTNAAVHGRPPVTVVIAIVSAQAATTPSAASGDPTALNEPLALYLSVTDTGSGPAVHFLPHATDRFARDDDARDRAGAGLGLALVNALLHQAGGELRLCTHDAHQRYGHRITAPCTHPRSGTTATVLLPMSRQLSPDPGSASTTVNRRAINPTPGTPTDIS